MPAHGRYSVLHKIANGGMAEIYLGRQQGAAGFERLVVLKRIRSAMSAERAFRDALIDEAHIAMTLNHSNVVQVLDLGYSGGHYFLILEMVDGWNLNMVFRRAEAFGLTFPPELALYCVTEVCRALAFAHSRVKDGKPLGIVHCDVSPHNVLVSAEGEVKLTDFGIATASHRRGRSDDGIIRGKVGFMSPEQAGGGKPDARSDLFSLGATLYFLVTGKKAFAAGTDLLSLALTQKGEFEPPEALRPNLDPGIVKVLQRAMKKQPEERYPSAEAMLAALEDLLRSRYPRTGPSELKSWLAELELTDQAPRVSHAPPAPEPEQESIEGSAIFLQDHAEPQTPAERPADTRWLTGSAKPALPGALLKRLDAAPRNAKLGFGAAVLASLILSARLVTCAGPRPEPLASSAPAPDAAEPAFPGLDLTTEVPEPADAGPQPRIAAEKSPEPIWVQFTSSPPGARLTVEKQAFGVTPARLRVKPGLTYEVSLARDGYKPASKRAYVPNKPNQTIHLELEKKSWWPF